MTIKDSATHLATHSTSYSANNSVAYSLSYSSSNSSSDAALFTQSIPNQITGSAAGDVLVQTQGNSVMTGQGGSDVFVIQYLSPTDTAQIADFNPAEDIIAVSIPSGFIGIQPDSFIGPDQFKVGTSADTDQTRFIYDINTGALYFDPDGTGPMQQGQVATLSPGLTLTPANFYGFLSGDKLSSIPAPSPSPANPGNGGSTPPPGTPGAPGTPGTPGNNGSTPGSGTSGNDRLIGTANDDTLIGLGGDDTLSGNDGNDLLKGDDGRDTLLGGNGNDRLFGGSGNNLLTGNQGRDVFVLEKGSGRSVVKDFQDRQDKLGLSAGIKFKALDIVQHGSKVTISLGNDPLALLQGVKANQISAADFTQATGF